MSTIRAYTREFRESAVDLVLSEGLSIRKAADDLGMPTPCHATHVALTFRRTRSRSSSSASKRSCHAAFPTSRRATKLRLRDAEFLSPSSRTSTRSMRA